MHHDEHERSSDDTEPPEGELRAESDDEELARSEKALRQWEKRSHAQRNRVGMASYADTSIATYELSTK